jgi:hypothetical protein
MKKAFPIALIVVGLVLIGSGIYTRYRGYDASNRVQAEVVAQNITTPEDASIPNARVRDAETAESMANIIAHHADEATGGRTYAELGRFLSVDGSDTNDEAQAMIGADGRPVANPLRATAFQASALQTSLYTSILAFNVAELVAGLGAVVIVLGLAVGGVGIALAGLAIPGLARRLHVEPVAASQA